GRRGVRQTPGARGPRGRTAAATDDISERMAARRVVPAKHEEPAAGRTVLSGSQARPVSAVVSPPGGGAPVAHVPVALRVGIGRDSLSGDVLGEQSFSSSVVSRGA